MLSRQKSLTSFAAIQESPCEGKYLVKNIHSKIEKLSLANIM